MPARSRSFLNSRSARYETTLWNSRRLPLHCGSSPGQHTKLPEIPSTVYNVKDYGAVGDNKTLNTLAIQKVLDQAKASGGKVLTPAGEYLCGPLNVYSKTNLELGGVNN